MSETPMVDTQRGSAGSADELSGYERAQQSVDRALRVADIAAAVLLAVATVATAWSAYQATRWSGVQATSFAEASTNRVESTRSFNFAIQILSIDANLFTDWVAAYESGNSDLQEFYETNLFRPEFLPYLEEWVASQPLTNPDALRNPIVNEEYQQELLAESDRLRAEAEAKFEEATDANQTGDEYILATVIFASVLFFAGISNKFERITIQGALVSLAFVMIILGVIELARLPVH